MVVVEPPPSSTVPAPESDGIVAVTATSFQYPATLAEPMVKATALATSMDPCPNCHFPAPVTSTFTVADAPDDQTPSFLSVGRGASAPGTREKVLAWVKVAVLEIWKEAPAFKEN